MKGRYSDDTAERPPPHRSEAERAKSKTRLPTAVTGRKPCGTHDGRTPVCIRMMKRYARFVTTLARKRSGLAVLTTSPLLPRSVDSAAVRALPLWLGCFVLRSQLIRLHPANQLRCIGQQPPSLVQGRNQPPFVMQSFQLAHQSKQRGLRSIHVLNSVKIALAALQ
jgi:hypothetical protein